MTKLLRICILPAALVLALRAEPASAEGPFGISAGDDPSRLPGCTAVANSPGRFNCSTVPRPHPDLVAYFVSAPPGVGACWVRAVSHEVQTGSEGRELRGLVDQFEAQISEKYGKDRRRIDINRDKDQRFWLFNLSSKNNFYSYLWSAASGAKLPDRIAEISVSAYADTITDALVVVNFEFDNNKACEDAERKAKAKAF